MILNCPKCSQNKPEEQFNKNKARATGRCLWCRDCQKCERVTYVEKKKAEGIKITHKKCKICTETKSVDHFAKHWMAKDGLRDQCNECRSSVAKVAAENVRLTGPTVTQKPCPSCQETLPAFEFSFNAYYPDGLDNECKACRAYKRQTWLHTSRYTANERSGWSVRWSLLKLRMPRWLSYDDRREIANKYKEARKLTRITGMKHHVDHIVPLKGESVSGLHVAWNLQILTERQNLQKGNRHGS